MSSPNIEPVYFASAGEFRDWLQRHHADAQEVVVGYYKKGSGRPSLTWPESVDEALCFGWIDGVRHSIDGERYCIRFTSRNPDSNWSAVNIRKAEALIAAGRMQPAGLRLFQQRKAKSTGQYSYENKPEQLPPHLEDLFRQHPEAWAFFTAQPVSYRKTVQYWIMSAKQESTRHTRLAKLIEASASRQRMF
jgi:uncharacterized protein YdeI (YjbR/CyaY-like superfamily)